MFPTDIRRSSNGRQDITLKNVDGKRIGSVLCIPDTDKIKCHLHIIPSMVDILDWLEDVGDIRSIIKCGSFWCGEIDHAMQVKCCSTDGLSVIMSRLIALDNGEKTVFDDFKLGLRMCGWSITIDSRY